MVKHFKVIVKVYSQCQVPVREPQSTKVSEQGNNVNKFSGCHQHPEKQTLCSSKNFFKGDSTSILISRQTRSENAILSTKIW